MSLYDGFFDATQNEETGEYDRAYGADDFTDYFAKIIGSGVCIHNNPDSFLVRLEGGQAVVSPGYLFINGYWLKNDADYTIPLSGTGTLAIVARPNTTQRMITLDAVPVAQSYPDSLVLALVNAAAGTVEDRRYDAEICGVIDTAGGLADKIAWATNYIDTEIDSKLADVEKEIAAQGVKLESKIGEAQAEVDKLEPAPVGTIKFSAEQNINTAQWLKCDGSAVSKDDYPALVAALQEIQGSEENTALLPDLEMGGIPAYIKAHTDTDMIDLNITVIANTGFRNYNDLLFNGEALIAGSYVRSVPKSGKFTVGLLATESQYITGYNYMVKLNGTTVAHFASGSPIGTKDIASFKVSDYAPWTIELLGDAGTLT